MDDLVGKLRCCAGVSPEAPVTRLNPAARTLLETAAEEIDRLRDKVDGLESDLDAAIAVAWRRGAHEWVRLNYPDHAQKPHRE